MNNVTITREEAEELTEGLGQVHAGGWRVTASLIRVGVPKLLEMSNEEWVKERLGGIVQLEMLERREAVKELVAEGMSQREIAAALGVSKSTVNDDLASVQNRTADDSGQHKHDENVQNRTPDEDALVEQLIAEQPPLDEDTTTELAQLMTYDPINRYRVQIDGIVTELYEFANTFPSIEAPMQQETYAALLQYADKASTAVMTLKAAVEQEIEEKGLI